MAVLGADVIVSGDTNISHSLVRSASVLLEHHVHRNSMINPHSDMNPSGVLNLRNHSLIHQLAASVGRIVAMVGCILSAPILILLSALLIVLNKPALIRKAAINQYNHEIFHYYVLGKFNSLSRQVCLSSGALLRLCFGPL